jgi:hypothetical protein
MKDMEAARLLEEKINGLGAEMTKLAKEVAGYTRILAAMTDDATAIHQAQAALRDAMDVLEAKLLLRTAKIEAELRRSSTMPPPLEEGKGRDG